MHLSDIDAAAAARSQERLEALRGAALLDTPAEAAFDRVTRLDTRILGVPISLVSLVDADRQFFKSCVGLGQPWAASRETPQVEAADAKQKGGSGLGLAIARAIVGAHDGRIWAESTPGYGATFSVTLPRPPRADSGE